jgi:hypothetical protein
MSLIDDGISPFVSEKVGSLFEKGVKRIQRIAKTSGWNRVIAEMFLISIAWFVVFYLLGQLFTFGFEYSFPMSLILGMLVFTINLVFSALATREAKRELVLERTWARLVEKGWDKPALVKLVNYIHEKEATSFEEIKGQLQFEASVEQIEEIVYHLIRKGAIKGFIDGQSVRLD